MMERKILLFLGVIIMMLLSCSKSDDNGYDDRYPRTYIIVSDIHLGDQRSIDDGYGWNLKEKDTLMAFMDYIVQNKYCNDFVIAGDFIDEWVAPADYITLADKEGRVLTEQEFFRAVVDANRKVFDKFTSLKKMGVNLTYIPGNHDMQTTEADFDAVVPGLFNQARTFGVDGMGEYQPETALFIEHGHRYDIMNAPYIGKNGFDSISGSILPPGFFVSRLNCSSKMNDVAMTRSIYDLDNISYNAAWLALGGMFGQEDVVTMTDGMTKTYSFYDYAFNTSDLFYGIDDLEEENDGWGARCKRLNAWYVPSVTESLLASIIYSLCDQMALKVLNIPDFGARILVWGHSHEPKFIVTEVKGEKRVHVNTGCWIDAKECGSGNNSTFCKVTALNPDEYHVSLCRFSLDNNGQGHVEVIAETIID